MEGKFYRLEAEFSKNTDKIIELKAERDNLVQLNKYLKYKSNDKRVKKINTITNQLERLRKRQISIKNQL